MSKRFVVSALATGALITGGMAAHSTVAAAAGAHDVVCPMYDFTPATEFTGTAHNLIVPENSACVLDGGTVTNDVIVHRGAEFGAENAVIGHDLNSDGASALVIGFYNGGVQVGHNINIRNSAPNPNFASGLDICATKVGNDVNIEHNQYIDEINIGDAAHENYNFCDLGLSQGNTDTIGGNLKVNDNVVFRIDIGDNSIGKDMTVNGNSLNNTPGDGVPADIDVSDNHVGNNATCEHNKPGLSADGTEDGPNFAKHNDGCVSS